MGTFSTRKPTATLMMTSQPCTTNLCLLEETRTPVVDAADAKKAIWVDFDDISPPAVGSLRPVSLLSNKGWGVLDVMTSTAKPLTEKNLVSKTEERRTKNMNK